MPQVHALLDRVQKLINDRSVASVASLADERVACNVNITAKHGTYRWHYDRNRYTALIYLNKVAGGETEMYPNYRLVLGRNVASRMQHFSDKLTGSRFIRNLFGKKLICSTAVGRLVIMRGDRCLHSVRPVMGDKDRINVILSFDVPGTTYKVADELNSYLYAETSESKADPNYSGKVG